MKLITLKTMNLDKGLINPHNQIAKRFITDHVWFKIQFNSHTGISKQASGHWTSAL